MNYSIDPQAIVLPKKGIESTQVSISGWSNRRMLFVDRKKNETYFQVTSEGNGCGRCGLCLKKMEQVGYKTGYRFWEMDKYYSLFQKLPGVPKDLSSQSLREFLKLPILD